MVRWGASRTIVLLAVGLTLALVPSAGARSSGQVPLHGIFVVGKTIAGVGLGYTQAQVKAHWGSLYTLCPLSKQCTAKQPVWLFEYAVGEPLGVAARFANGKTVAVFTLGTPGANSLSAGGGGGWKTADGLQFFDPTNAIYSLYPAATLNTQCTLYSALSMKQGNVTSSFYLSSGTVYGFALTAKGQPICQ